MECCCEVDGALDPRCRDQGMCGKDTTMNQDFLEQLREFIGDYSKEPGISGEELVKCLEAEADRLRTQMRRLEG